MQALSIRPYFRTSYKGFLLRFSRLLTTGWLILFLVAFSSHAEDSRNKLQRLRSEIDSLRSRLESKATEREGIVERLHAVDQQIATRQRLINELEAQREQQLRQVKKYEREIVSTKGDLRQARLRLRKATDEVERLEDLIRRRAVYVYKHGNVSSLQFLLAAKSTTDLLNRHFYIERIQEQDKKNLLRLRKAESDRDREQQSIQTLLGKLEKARQDKLASAKRAGILLEENNQEKKKMEKDRASLALLLKEVKQDATALEDLIAEREKAAEKIEEWITALENRRISGTVQEIHSERYFSSRYAVHPVTRFDPFSRAKGKLPWPVDGKIIRKFGLEKDRETGTVTENPGVDIRADEGDEVIAVQGECVQ